MTDDNVHERLEYLRGEIRAERISQGEILELQGMAKHINPDDVELREWAGLPEFKSEFTVVAIYHDNMQLYCTTVEAFDPDGAIEQAWEVCKADNGWSPDLPIGEQWAEDKMVIAGTIEVVG